MHYSRILQKHPTPVLVISGQYPYIDWSKKCCISQCNCMGLHFISKHKAQFHV